MPRIPDPETAYHRVQGLSRGLAVLRALNLDPSGSASVRALGEATGLHRTTVRRLLETLALDGYVERSESADTYRLRLEVRDLSDGFRDDQWIASVAAPAMGELLQRVRWPSDLTTLDGSCMRIRESTHRFSSLSFERAMVGRRLPLMFTASGRAYLAACDETERALLVKVMVADGGPQAACAADPRLLQNTVARVWRNGYANAEGDWRRHSPAGAIALPVRLGERVVGCLNVVYLRRAMAAAEAARELLPALREAVAAIEAGLATAPARAARSAGR
jgi:IclR family mhp operon transcriptional activator